MMKYIKLALGCFIFALSSIAIAEDCNWSLNGIGGANVSVPVTHVCRASGRVVATRVVTVNAKSVPCSIQVASGYKNTGSCINPNILKKVIATSCNSVFKTNVPGPEVNATYPAYHRYCSACGMTSNSPTFIGSWYYNGELMDYYNFVCR